jgi:hypothetical protein
MPQKSKQNRSLLAISALAALIAATAPATEASATWMIDLVFPPTAPVPKPKPDRTVTGSIPQENKTPGARQTGRETVPKASRKGTRRSSVSNVKDAQR